MVEGASEQWLFFLHARRATELIERAIVRTEAGRFGHALGSIHAAYGHLALANVAVRKARR